MNKRLTRRDFAKLAGIAAVAAAGGKGSAQEPVKDAGLEDELKELEAKLGAPFSPEARKIALESLKNVESAGKRRLKFKLPENSEPCTLYKVKK